MMLPMSIRCNTCGNFIYKGAPLRVGGVLRCLHVFCDTPPSAGTKFNSRKEDAVGEEYLGIMVYRFYFKCPRCSAELVMKTDPKNSDYVVEAGASRNYEPWKDADAQVEAAVKQKEEEESGDAMKALEARTAASKREIDINNALDELRSMSNRHATVGIDDVLAAVRRKEAEEAEMFNAQVDAAAKAVFSGGQAAARPGPSGGQLLVRRIEDDDDEDGEGEGAGAKRPRIAGPPAQAGGAAAPPPKAARPQVMFAVKKKEAAPPAPVEAAQPAVANPLLSGLAMYGSSSGEED